MAPQSGESLEVRPQSKSRRSPSRSPKPKNRKKTSEVTSHYGSDGVKENNIFNLPTSDYKVLAFLTLVAAVVRLFRIYQPSSVVFDEVQYIPFYLSARFDSVLLIPAPTVSVVSRPSTSRVGSLWMFIHRLPNSF